MLAGGIHFLSLFDEGHSTFSKEPVSRLTVRLEENYKEGRRKKGGRLCSEGVWKVIVAVVSRVTRRWSRHDLTRDGRISDHLVTTSDVIYRFSRVTIRWKNTLHSPKGDVHIPVDKNSIHSYSTIDIQFICRAHWKRRRLHCLSSDSRRPLPGKRPFLS